MTKANLKRLEEGKLYYSISEVCTMTGLEQHVLRYWESEFPQLRPKKNRSGNRAYRAKEIKIIRYIKYLLYEEMYTIPGAKKKMADANMSDLDGQLTLLRVAPTPAPSPEPAAIAIPESVQQPSLHSNGHAENGSANGNDSHLNDGGPAAARLREELKRVKQELQSLLAALATSGRESH
ncbi:MAG: MerR family transcriptional regulator [Fibrobacteres bacterium]|nr:MerR family transcriptional regulator [Fibrobacterota bacterium]